jgi:hypothetical protein
LAKLPHYAAYIRKKNNEKLIKDPVLCVNNGSPLWDVTIQFYTVQLPFVLVNPGRLWKYLREVNRVH